ncbi:MAG: DUF2948 family protein [Hyphomicrobiaceae bacterium]|nr:DUF2948 family protein [Hyphomicrobiaceae bacterium]
MQDLKLQALDGDDLKMLSAHCQDAVVRIDEMAYQAASKRFALVCNRFDWANVSRKSGWFQPKTFERRRAGLRFEHVLGVKVHGFNPNAGAGNAVPALTLLAIRYQPTAPDNPAGHITLAFGGGAAVRLDVGAIEAELRDLGGVWSTETKPDHDNPPPPTNSGRAEGRKS